MTDTDTRALPPATIPAEDVWLSQPELARRLGYSLSTIARLRKRGLPHVGTDRRRRYHWPTVLRWLAVKG